MADRVTPAEVIAIMGADTTLTVLSIVPYITTANVFVTDALTGKLSDAVLKLTEMWLAAHMASVTRERLSKEAGAGGAYIKYAGVWESELSSTQYGQMVLMLDTSNTLRNLKDGKKEAYIYAVPGV